MLDVTFADLSPPEAGLRPLSRWFSVEQTFLNLVRLSSLTVVPLVLFQNVISKPKAIWLFSWVVFLAFYGFAFRSVTRRVSSVKGVGRVWIHCFARGCPVVPVPFTEGLSSSMALPCCSVTVRRPPLRVCSGLRSPRSICVSLSQSPRRPDRGSRAVSPAVGGPPSCSSLLTALAVRGLWPPCELGVSLPTSQDSVLGSDGTVLSLSHLPQTTFEGHGVRPGGRGRGAGGMLGALGMSLPSFPWGAGATGVPTPGCQAA